MADSSRVRRINGANYALVTTPAARRFRPRLWPTLAAALLLALFIAAGQWQWTKAGIKSALQQQLDARSAEAEQAMPTTPVDAQSIIYRKVIARGHYETQYQILIDNRSHQQQAGYHVITPLRLEGSDVRLLVNRGWVPALAEHDQLPQFATPGGTLDVRGTAVLPASRFFTLGKDMAGRAGEWQSVWQNLDLARYASAVRFPIQPVVIELDGRSDAGGFVREWRRPDQGVRTNLGYALHWWAFAATTVALWLRLNFRRPS
jgi:surfeit locus 1 family protein